MKKILKISVLVLISELLIKKLVYISQTYLKYESLFDTRITSTSLWIPSLFRFWKISLTHTLCLRFFFLEAIVATASAIKSNSSSLLLLLLESFMVDIEKKTQMFLSLLYTGEVENVKKRNREADVTSMDTSVSTR